MHRILIHRSITGLLAVFATVAMGWLQAGRTVRVRVNTVDLGRGIRVGLPGREEILFPVATLARALDGPNRSDSSRLRVRRAELTATRSGGCATCRVRVVRPVTISTRVRAVNGAPAVPLEDLVTAFEGRVEADSSGTQYTIHVGRCTWCILEPASPLNGSRP